MKKILLTTALLVAAWGASAQRFLAKETYIRFFSSTPVEDIEATTNTAVSVWDKATGEVAFQVNNLHSDKYPKATFKGKLTDASAVNWDKDGAYTAQLKGTMNIHGVDKVITVPVTVVIKDKTPSISSKFKVKCVDYNIEIPTLVLAKIAEEIEVTVKAKFDLMKS
jgi:polyisoprenoid-binding protein YceI